MVQKGLLLNNKYQDFPDFCTMYPADYFCPKDHRTGKIRCTKNTVCIHHFAGSWLQHKWYKDLRHSLKLLLVKLIGEEPVTIISDILTLRIFKNLN